ncbi:MAG TPA: TIGR03085 family metal-binding protein [Nocardioides sp.]|nr:TIGR03085 family metal-binding protein [Nocardioides sp.]
MTTTLARRERAALCDLAAELGAGASTLCDGWDARHLLAHLVVRERRPWASVGIIAPPLAGLHDREIEKVAKQSFTALVERVRDPGLTPLTIGPVDRAVNTIEFFVHHEDLRRAQPTWEPRPLPPQDEKLLWGLVQRGGRMLVRKAGVPVTVRAPGGRNAVLRDGEDRVTVSGPVSELVMFLYGRKQVRVELDGTVDSVAKLEAAPLGI